MLAPPPLRPVASAPSTRPPGNTHAPGTNPAERCRFSSRISGASVPSRTSTAVAAGRGGAMSAGGRRIINPFDPVVRDRLDRLRCAAAQRMHHHDVTAAYVCEQCADGDLLRRYCDIDIATLHEIDIGRTIDQRQYLARTKTLGEHRGKNIRFFIVRHCAEHIGRLDVFLDQQFLVGSVAAWYKITS